MSFRVREIGFYFAIGFALSLFVACGSSSDSDSKKDAAGAVEILDKSEAELENGEYVVCDKSLEGAVALVVGGSFRRCEDGAWVKISRADALESDDILGMDDEVSSSSVPNSSNDVIPDADRESSNAQVADIVVSKESELPTCSAKRDGKTAYVEKEDKTYLCKDYEWSLVNASSSSSSVTPSSSSDVTPSSSGAKQSSSSVAPAEVKNSGYYKTNCPSGHICSYVTTEYLNPSKTYGEILDTRDYQVYKTIEICDEDNANCQTWMAQNLNYVYKGVPYSYTDGSTTYTSDSTSWCYENATKNCETYGRLYTWAAAIDSVALANDVDNPQTCGYGVKCDRLSMDALSEKPIQGVCPGGWHLPSNAEWEALQIAVGYSTAGRAIKSTSGWNSSGNGSNAYGFSALSAGYRYCGSGGGFEHAGYYAYIWSASQHEYDKERAYNINLYYYNDLLGLVYSIINHGLSVRCIKD